MRCLPPLLFRGNSESCTTCGRKGLNRRIIRKASDPRKNIRPSTPLRRGQPELVLLPCYDARRARRVARRFPVSAETSLSPDIAIVTGGSRGIGLAIARRLGRLGARVAICARSADAVERAATELRSAGIEVMAAAADVSAPDSVRRFVTRVHEALGDASILVNNAGVGVFRPAHEIDEPDWDRVLDTNLKGAWLMSREVAPQMIRQKRGHIIHIASLAGKNTFAGGGAYCASKWGLRGLAGCMAEDLRGHGIRVSVVFPGTVHTEFSPHAGKEPSRMLQPEDVAHVVEMLVRQAPGSFVSEVDLRPTQKP